MVVRIRFPVKLELTVFAGKMQHAPSTIKLIERAGARYYLRHLLTVSSRHQHLTVVWSRLNICSIAGPPFFITSVVILSYPVALVVRSSATTDFISSRLMLSSSSASPSPGCSSSSTRSSWGNSLFRCRRKCSLQMAITSSVSLTMLPSWSLIAFNGRFLLPSSSLVL